MDIVFSLCFSALLLYCAAPVLREKRYPAIGVFLVSLWLGVGTLAGMMLPAVMIQGLFLTIAALFVSKTRPRRSWPIGIGTTVAAYVVVSIWAYHDILQARARFPFESIESRLPAAPTNADPIGAETLEDVETIEAMIRSGDGRARALAAIHQLTIAQFLEQPGFGVTRMSGIRRSWRPRLEMDRSPTPFTNANPSSIPSAAIDEDAVIEIPERRPLLQRLHLDGVVNFLNGERFGYFVDRKHVVGFEPHRFSEKPAANEQKITRVELLGLVVHPQPVVYVSAQLPDMTDLARLPLRDPDAFETRGLAAIRVGDALYARESASGIRMLGPIRATKQCIECHGCERGTLLGAFSYVLEVPSKQ